MERARLLVRQHLRQGTYTQHTQRETHTDAQTRTHTHTAVKAADKVATIEEQLQAKAKKPDLAVITSLLII